MKLLLISCLVAFAAADVSHIVGHERNANILNQNFDVGVEGQYQWAIETDNGISAQAKGALNNPQADFDVGVEGQYQGVEETDNIISAQAKGALNNPQAENPSQIVQGSAQWKTPEGEVVQFAYTADENGYQVQGSHVPTPPPVPAAIIRSLEYIRAHPPKPEA
ncbi:unnamed protein product [Colias eurytheme]|nr:unnamed protein product [Colias eurytheme]